MPRFSSVPSHFLAQLKAILCSELQSSKTWFAYTKSALYDLISRKDRWRAVCYGYHHTTAEAYVGRLA